MADHIGDNFDVLVRQCHGRISFDKNGKTTARESYEIGYAFVFDKAPKIGSKHELFPFLYVTRVEVEETEGDMAMVYVTYEGAPLSEGSTKDTYELSVETVDEPIETHPDFPTWINDANKETNKPIFRKVKNSAGEEVDKFEGWGKGSPFEGIEKYLSPRAVWSVTRITRVATEDISAVGKIGSPLGTPPALGSGRNWLFSSYSETDEGSIFRQKWIYKASGPKPWKTEIYS